MILTTLPRPNTRRRTQSPRKAGKTRAIGRRAKANGDPANECPDAYAGRRYSQPGPRRLVLGTLFAGFCLNLVPWQGPALLTRPDLLLLMLIYWCMHEPRSVGAASASLAD